MPALSSRLPPDPSATPSSRLRFAANLSFLFQDLDPGARFAAAAEAGFDAVEMLFAHERPVAWLSQRLDAAGLTLALFNLPAGDWVAGERGLAALPGRKTEFEASLDIALAHAEALGVPRLHMMAGIADPGDAASRATYVERLALAADRALPLGIDIMIEPINGRDMPGYFLNSFDLAEQLIHAVDRPNVRLQFDIYHRQIIAGDVMTGLSRLMPLIGHVQIASVPDRNEPGTGELDDFAVFARLADLGYDGVIGCEYRPRESTLAGLGWLASARRRLSGDNP